MFSLRESQRFDGRPNRDESYPTARACLHDLCGAVFTADTRWGVGVGFLGYRVAYKAGWGGTRRRAFLSVTLPLSLPGVIAAFLFVFIPTVGEFVTPSLVGGTSGYMYGNQITDLFGSGFPDWRTGSVLSLFLLAVVGVLVAVFSKFNQLGDPLAD